MSEKFENPDTPSEEQERFNWDDSFQAQILALLLTDKAFLLECLALVKPQYFKNKEHNLIYQILSNYFDKYKSLPNNQQIIEEIRLHYKDKKESITNCVAELKQTIEFFVPNLENRLYYRDKIKEFAKRQSLKEAFLKCKELLDKANGEEVWTDINELLKNALLLDHNFDIGHGYFQDYEERYNRKESSRSSKDLFTTGFHAIDSGLKNNGLIRGEIGSWIGLSGTGKSLALVAAALANIKNDKKVLYITLEIDEDAVAERFDAQFADPAGTFGVTTKNLKEHKEVVFSAIKEQTEHLEDQRLLVLKRFPGGTMDIPTLRAYFAQTVMHGFKPDLVIVDYVGEMKDYPNIPIHESRYRIVRDLRCFAIEEGVCVLTAMQPNRSAKEVVRTSNFIDDDNLGDSYAQVKPLDAFWSINQMQEEKECGLARVFVIKHREGKSRFSFNIEFDYNTLSMKQISSQKYDEKFKGHMNKRDINTRDVLMSKDASYNLPKKDQKAFAGFGSTTDEGASSPEE